MVGGAEKVAPKMSGSGGNSSFGDCYPLFTSDILCDVILGFRRLVGLISMVCCVFIVAVIILFKKYKFLSQRLILYLSVSAFFQSASYISGDYHISHKAENGELVGLCIFLGVFNLFIDWVSFLWVCCITFNIFWIAVFQQRTEKFEKFYFVVDLVLPVVICCFPFIGLSYGPAGLWCWISSVRDGVPYSTGIALQFAVFYGPFWALAVVMIVALIVACCKIHQWTNRYKGSYGHMTDSREKLWQEEIKPLLLFPWIYIIILVFPAMNRIRVAFGYGDAGSAANFIFWFMHAIFIPLQGTAYALVFACDKTTMSRLNWRHIKAAMMERRKKGQIIKEYPIEDDDEDKTFNSIDGKYSQNTQLSYIAFNDGVGNTVNS